MNFPWKRAVMVEAYRDLKSEHGPQTLKASRASGEEAQIQK